MAETPSAEEPVPGHSDEPPKGIFAMAVSILWGILAFALGFESVVNFNNWLRSDGRAQDAVIASIDLVLCFAVGIFAVTLWRARASLPGRVRSAAVSVSTNPSVWVAVLLVILIISAPRMRLQQPKSPSVDEIANAVARDLAPIFTNKQREQATIPTPAPAYVNPFHPDIVKWNIASGLRLAISRGSLNANCHITIVRLQESYPEDYADDFKRILDVIGWPYDERFATNTIQKGFTIRAINAPGAAKDCAENLNNRVGNSQAPMRKGNLSGSFLQWYTTTDAPYYLKSCNLCIEVDFGNDDGR